jgi:hypothetical protein
MKRLMLFAIGLVFLFTTSVFAQAPATPTDEMKATVKQEAVDTKAAVNKMAAERKAAAEKRAADKKAAIEKKAAEKKAKGFWRLSKLQQRILRDRDMPQSHKKRQGHNSPAFFYEMTITV